MSHEDVTDVVKLVGLGLESCSIWTAGAAPPETCEKEIVDGEAVIAFDAADTVSTTGMVSRFGPPVMVMFP